MNTPNDSAEAARQQAREKKAELLADKEWVKRYWEHGDASKERTELLRLDHIILGIARVEG